jgi:hypothetical protein
MELERGALNWVIIVEGIKMVKIVYRKSLGFQGAGRMSFYRQEKKS